MPEVDKKAQSIEALKNANKHLAEVFAELSKKDLVLKNTADDLQRVARQCGDIYVSVWVGSKQEYVPLKKFLDTCANTLNEAR